MRARSVGRKVYWLIGAVALLALVLAPKPARNQEKVELGQLVEGVGSANFSWLKVPGIQFAVAFRSPKTGTVTDITMQWKAKGGYGGGTYGIYTFQLRANGKDNFPSDTVLATATDITPEQATDGRLDGAFRIPLTAILEEGQIYHLVITNTDPTPKANWSSPNTLMTRVTKWDGTGSMSAFFADGTWRPWGSQRNPFNEKKINEVNCAHCPLMLRWTDGTITGDPYYSAAVKSGAYFFGGLCGGQLIKWDRQNTTVSRVGISVWKRGTPGNLIYHLEDADGTELATGTIAGAKDVGAIATWVYTDLPKPVELKKGRTYRLWFASPDSPDAENCYYQCVPYGDNRPPEWLKSGWGGTASHYIAGDGVTWTARESADLTFSLQ